MRLHINAYVRCKKEMVVTILNRACFNAGLKNDPVFVIDDSLETINKKIEGLWDEGPITLLDFLDDKNRKDFLEHLEQSLVFGPPSEDQFLEDVQEGFRVFLAGVMEINSEYTIEVRQAVEDGDEWNWQDWCERMVRLYGCRVVYKEETYEGGPWHSSCFYDPDGEDVKQTQVDTPIIDFTRYWELMDRLKEETEMSRCTQLELAISDHELLASQLKRNIDALKNDLYKEYKKEGYTEDEPDKEISDEDLPF